MAVKKTLSCSIQPSPIQYDIVIGENLLNEALAFSKTISIQSIIITTDAVNLILPKFRHEKIVLPSGEGIKSRAIKEKIEDALIERGWGRESCLIAIGGGALLDLVGFVASTYCRGIPYISYPTTILAMTDAALGGKTGVNVEEAKNWIGSFHHASKIFVDLSLIKSLSDKEYHYGFSEAIKHSLIADVGFFYYLEENTDRIIKRDFSLLSHVIYQSCMIKKSIIEKDPYETKGFRRILNFGHTIGHALETLSEYTLSHGQAVIMGMIIETYLAHQMGYLSAPALERINKLLKRFPFNMAFPKHLPFEMLKRDKKGAHRFVVLTGIGSVATFEGEYVTTLTSNHLKRALEDVMRNYTT